MKARRNQRAPIVALAFGLCACALPSGARAQDPIKWSLAVTSKGPVLPGKPVDAGLTAKIEKGWHLYTLIEPDGGPSATVITLAGTGPFVMAGDVIAPTGETAYDPNFDLQTEFFEKEVTFLVPLRVPSGTPLGRSTISVKTSWQTCNDRLCLPPTEAIVSLAVDVGPTKTAVVVGGGAPAPPPASTVEPTTNTTAVTPGAQLGAIALVPDLAASSKASTLGAYIGLAALMGALSLLTPCVFPMVPITVSYFTSRARKRRRDAGLQALTYGLGIVLTFTGLGFLIAIAFGASGLNQFAANPWLNLAVTAMFVGFALSLFGIREVALPSKLLTALTKADEGKGQLAGTLLMGLAFTVTSFTCTAPFLGTLLVLASQGDWQWPLAGMLAFSSVFALPFVILAFVPQLVATLPKSGPWLVAIKAVMGIVELAAAMKFLSNADLVWGWHVFTRPVVLASWVILSIVLVVYLAGLVRLGPAPKLGRPGFARGFAAAAAGVLGLWLASGLGGRRLGELEAFLPPADLTAFAAKGELPWIINDYDMALVQAGGPGQRILIDFTGYTCTNCRWMEANMFTRPEIARELSRYVRVRLYTDGRGEVFRKFQQMEQKIFGTVALPYYAVMTSDGKPLVGFGGLTRDPTEYLAFLRKGVE